MMFLTSFHNNKISIKPNYLTVKGNKYCNKNYCKLIQFKFARKNTLP